MVSEIQNSTKVVESASSLLDEVFRSFSAIYNVLSVSNFEAFSNEFSFFNCIILEHVFLLCGELFVFIVSILGYNPVTNSRVIVMCCNSGFQGINLP